MREKTSNALEQLREPRRGKKKLTSVDEWSASIAVILKRDRTDELFKINLQVNKHQKTTRRYVDEQPQTTESTSELGGLADSGTVGLSVNGGDIRLTFRDGVRRQNVSLSNRAEVNVRAGGGESITINARNLNISGTSTQVRAGIDRKSSSISSKAGNIEINTTEAVNTNESVVSNVVLEEGVGKIFRSPYMVNIKRHW